MGKPLYTHPCYSTVPTIHTPSPLSNPYIPYTTDMFSIFDGSNEDAYWWILSTESYFRATGKSEMAKMMVAALAMRGEALKWWLWWSHRHPQSDWDTFTTALLWRFKPEWQHLLPVLDEETEEASESSTSEVRLSRVEDCVVDLVCDIVGEHNLDSPPCLKLVEKPSITHDSVDSVGVIAGEQDQDSLLKPEVQVVQLKIADSIDRVQQWSLIVTTGDKKFSNPALGPQFPKPPDTTFAPPFPPPPKPPDRNVATGFDPLYAPVSLHKYSPPQAVSLFDPGGSQILTTSHFNFYPDVVTNVVLLHWLYDRPVTIISTEIPPSEPPDNAAIPASHSVTLHKFPSPIDLSFGLTVNASIALLKSLSLNITLRKIFLGSQLITVSWKNSSIEAKFTIHPFCLASCCTNVVHRFCHVEFFGFKTNESNESVKIEFSPNTYYMFAIMPIKHNLFQILQIIVTMFGNTSLESCLLSLDNVVSVDVNVDDLSNRHFPTTLIGIRIMALPTSMPTSDIDVISFLVVVIEIFLDSIMSLDGLNQLSEPSVRVVVQTRSSFVLSRWKFFVPHCSEKEEEQVILIQTDTASVFLFSNVDVWSKCPLVSGLWLELIFLAAVGTFVFSYDFFVLDTGSSCGVYPYLHVCYYDPGDICFPHHASNFWNDIIVDDSFENWNDALHNLRFPLVCDKHYLFLGASEVLEIMVFWSKRMAVKVENNIVDILIEFDNSIFFIAKVFYSCIQRYSHLLEITVWLCYCIIDVGEKVAIEPSCQKAELMRNILEILTTLPLCSLLSLHHPHHIATICSHKTTSDALQQLVNMVNVDSIAGVMTVVLYKEKALDIFRYHSPASVSSPNNLYVISNKSQIIQDGPNACAYFVGLLQRWLDRFKWLNSLCGTVFKIIQGEVAEFHSYAITNLATFLHLVTDVMRSGISKYCVGASALSELAYNVVGIRLNVANGCDIALHGAASFFAIHHGFMKHSGLIDVVKDELFGWMCDLQGIAAVYNQEVDGSLHFNCEQWDPGGYLDLKMSTIVRFSQFKQWDPGKFMVEAGFYNLEDKVGLEGVGNDRIFRIRSANVVTQLVLEVVMTHLNLEASRRYIVRG